MYPSAEFEWNTGQYLLICEVCLQVQDKGPVLLRADEAKSLVEMDDREVVIIVEEVVESKDNVMQQQQQPREKKSVRFGAPLSELELQRDVYSLSPSVDKVHDVVERKFV